MISVSPKKIDMTQISAEPRVLKSGAATIFSPFYPLKTRVGKVAERVILPGFDPQYSEFFIQTQASCCCCQNGVQIRNGLWVKKSSLLSRLWITIFEFNDATKTNSLATLISSRAILSMPRYREMFKLYEIDGDRNLIMRSTKVHLNLKLDTLLKQLTVCLESFQKGYFQLIEFPKADYLAQEREGQLHLVDITRKMPKKGGNGLVFKVLNVTTGKSEKLKTARLEKIHKKANEKILYEIRALQELNAKMQMPFFPPIPYAQLRTKLQNRYVVGYLSCWYEQDLKSWATQPQTPSDRLSVFKQIVDIVVYLEKRDYVNRDLKFENFLLEIDGQKKVKVIMDDLDSVCNLKGPYQDYSVTRKFITRKTREWVREFEEESKACKDAESSAQNFERRKVMACSQMKVSLGVTAYMLFACGKDLPDEFYEPKEKTKHGYLIYEKLTDPKALQLLLPVLSPYGEKISKLIPLLLNPEGMYLQQALQTVGFEENDKEKDALVVEAGK